MAGLIMAAAEASLFLGAAPTPAPTAAESMLVIHNIAKRHNIGTMVRSATAFGVSEMILIGRRDFNAFGSHGSTAYLRFRHFTSLSQARLYLKEERNCDICGVEIVDGALPITQQPFRRSTAFLLGNEGTGLSDKECEICDFFVYIPQYGCGTASLNVTVAASIVLHHFGGFLMRSNNGLYTLNMTSLRSEWLFLSVSAAALSFLLKATASLFRRSTQLLLPPPNRVIAAGKQPIGGSDVTPILRAPRLYRFWLGVASHSWAGFAERSLDGNKFSVAMRPVKQARRNFCSESVESVIEERKNRREFGLQDMFCESKADHSQETNLLGVLFDN